MVLLSVLLYLYSDGLLGNIHTAPELCGIIVSVAVPPQRPYGLLGNFHTAAEICGIIVSVAVPPQRPYGLSGNFHTAPELCGLIVSVIHRTDHLGLGGLNVYLDFCTAHKL